MNLRLYLRYKINLFSGLTEFMMLIFVFSIFATALYYKSGYENLTQSDIMIFYMGSILIIAFNSTALWGPINNVNRDLYNGVLEYLYVNPVSKYGYFVGSIIADGTIKFTVLFIPSLVIMSLITGIFNQPITMVEILAICCVVLINLISMGILVSLTAILWKQVNSIASMINILFQFLAGGFFPITTFPQPLQYLSYLLPQTFGYDLVRYVSFHGTWSTILPFTIELIVLILFAGIYLVLSIILLQKTEKFAKKTGLNRI